MKKIFFDCEFIGFPKTPKLISIGMVSDCNKTFYAEFNDFDTDAMDYWVRRNVYKHFNKCEDNTNSFFKSNATISIGNASKIKNDLSLWLSQFDNCELWADCLVFDWMLLNTLFDWQMPKNVYIYPMDIVVLLNMNKIDCDIHRETLVGMDDSMKHHALHDAKVCKAIHDKFILQ